MTRKVIELKTARLKLRQWHIDDRPIFAQMNADPAVMEFYPNVMDTHESNAMAIKLELLLAERSWGFWAIELIDKKSFIGFVGLHEPTYDLPVTPCVEIGWRLAKEYWGNGYATEAAKISIDFAFNKLNLHELYSFTSVSNNKSRAVMERLNMVNTGSNFEHPIIPENHHLREHVLYKINKQQWLEVINSPPV
jgi:RimJ/RimL family protein N-acetyltransferase